MPITLANVRTGGDYAQLNRFEVSGLTTGSGLTIPDDDLKIRTLSTTIPKQTAVTAPIEVLHPGGIKNIQAGAADRTGQITLTCVETTNMVLSKFLNAWRDLIQAPDTGDQALTEDLTADEVVLTRYGRSWDKVLGYYRLKYVFLADFDHGGDVSGDATDAQRPTMTLQFVDSTEEYSK